MSLEKRGWAVCKLRFAAYSWQRQEDDETDKASSDPGAAAAEPTRRLTGAVEMR